MSMSSLWYGENFSLHNVVVDNTASCTHCGVMGIPVKVTIWLLNFNGAPGNNHGNLG